MKANRLTQGSIHGAVRDLVFTGERIVPGKTEEALFREHEARYVFAGQYVAGKRVLDIACGTGIGTSYLLKAGAQSCMGLDIDEQAIAYARTLYPACTFAVSDALEMNLGNSSVDVVVSFETIEHVSDQVKFLMECRRVLRPEGLLICSTPNKKAYQWLGNNPFHVREFTLKEFKALLDTSFDGIDYYGQAPRFYFAYVARVLALRCLSLLGIKEALKKVVGWKPSPLCAQDEFSDSAVSEPVWPLRRSAFVEPGYFIAMGRKRCEWSGTAFPTFLTKS